MKTKLEQAIKECLEESGYAVRLNWINSEDDLNKNIINFSGNIQIRAKKL